MATEDEHGSPRDYQLEYDPTRMFELPGGLLGYQHQSGDTDSAGNEDPVPELVATLVDRVTRNARALDEARGVEDQGIGKAVIYISFAPPDDPENFSAWEVTIKRVNEEQLDHMLDEARRVN